MRKFLFDVILGIFIAIGACVVGIIAIIDKVDELKRRSYGFAEVVDNLVTSIKDLIHHLRLYCKHYGIGFPCRLYHVGRDITAQIFIG